MPRCTIHCRWSLSVFFIFCQLSGITVAQRQIDNTDTHLDQNRSVYHTAPDTGVVIFRVFAEREGAPLDRQALVKLVNLENEAVTWKSTDESKGVFTNVAYGDYDAEISAVGYLSWHKNLKVVSFQNILDMDIVLQRDSSAVNLDVAISVLSPQARKETKRAISALKSGKLEAAQKHLDRISEFALSDAGISFLLGYFYFQKKDYVQASNYLGTSTTLNQHNPQAFALLGRASLERKDFPAARSALEHAILDDDENWLPHSLLANACLGEKDYGKARDEAQVAIAKGKKNASSARLVLGEALLNLGQTDDGIQALSFFLQESPRHPLAGQVRNLIAQVQDRNSKASRGTDALQKAQVSGVDSLSALPAPRLSLPPWQPSGIDDAKLPFAAGVTCPSERVIEEAGKQVDEFVNDVARFAAVEDLFHQPLDEYGVPIRTETRKYNYVATISEPQPGFLEVDENRYEKSAASDYPDRIASTGFVTFALIFHPHMRDSFNMVCEGLGDWHGQATWLVRFVQRDDRPNHIHSYKIGSEMYPVSMKGRAWITADNFHILRIEAEMVHPMPEIQLLSEHPIVEYGPIPFEKKNTTLWLPKSVDIYFDFRKHHYYRRHSFDHYMLFSVDSSEKRKEPKIP